MAISYFDDKTKQPTETDLKTALGASFESWKELIKIISARFAPLQVEWGCSAKSVGWGVRLKQEKRAVLYMVPCKGHFLASFALGEKAVKAAHESKLPKSVLDLIDAAPKYAEGRGVRLPVKNNKDVKNMEALAIIKMTS